MLVTIEASSRCTVAYQQLLVAHSSSWQAAMGRGGRHGGTAAAGDAAWWPLVQPGIISAIGAWAQPVQWLPCVASLSSSWMHARACT
jgi:hypothetical protein